jgi:hypothetical protein
VFNPAAGSLTFTDLDQVDLARLALVTNVASNEVLFNFADPARGGSVAGNVLTLDVDTSAMSAADPLRVDYDSAFGDIAYDRVVVGNSRSKFRDGFAQAGEVQPNPDTWDIVQDTPGAHILTQGGDSSGSSYLRISLSPFVEADGLAITSRRRFQYPMKVGFGVSMSQRISGQEVFIGMVGCAADGSVPVIAPVADKAVTGATASVTSNVATFTMTAHGFKGGDRVVVYGSADHRFNVGPVAVTVLTADTFNLPVTITNGTYTVTGAMIRSSDPLRYAANGAGLLFENTTSTNASLVARRNGAKFRSSTATVASSTATQGNSSPYTDAFNASGVQELYFTMDELSMRSYAADSQASTSGSTKFSQGIPDEELEYKIQVRARNLNGYSLPIGRVVSVAKSGTTTATVVTDVAHGLVAGDFVQVYGARDQTNFPQLSAQTAIASVVDPFTFTVVWGTAVTAASAGGVVWVNQGQVAAPGVSGQAIQSVSRAGGILTLNGNTTWSGPVPGEYWQVHGLEPAASAYEGAYKVLRVSGSVLELAAPGADFGSIATGGAAFRRTDVRLHFARVMDYTRLATEIVGGKGNVSDINGAVPVALTGSASIPASASQSTGSTSSIWYAAGYGGLLVNDIASAAITSTTTSSAVTPGLLANVGTYAHTFNIAVTAVTGTTPTMDVAVEESADNGTNWVRIYEFPRITANGSYTSPLIRSQLGTRYRYVRTLAGTSPSFTMSLNRVQFSSPGEVHKQFFDRSIVLTTLNSATPVYFVDGCNKFQVVANLGAATTPPVLQLQGSEDGAAWYNMGPALNTVASSTVVAVADSGLFPRFARVIVSTAGVTVTAGYVSVKALKA